MKYLFLLLVTIFAFSFARAEESVNCTLACLVSDDEPNGNYVDWGPFKSNYEGRIELRFLPQEDGSLKPVRNEDGKASLNSSQKTRWGDFRCSQKKPGWLQVIVMYSNVIPADSYPDVADGYVKMNLPWPSEQPIAFNLSGKVWCVAMKKEADLNQVPSLIFGQMDATPSFNGKQEIIKRWIVEAGLQNEYEIQYGIPNRKNQGPRN
jgi:hypothetical protein